MPTAPTEFCCDMCGVEQPISEHDTDWDICFTCVSSYDGADVDCFGEEY